MAVKKKAGRAELDALIAQSSMRSAQKISLEAEADLKYLAARAAEGHAIGFGRLRAFMQERHGIAAGRRRLRTLITSLGCKPWFCE